MLFNCYITYGVLQAARALDTLRVASRTGCLFRAKLTDDRNHPPAAAFRRFVFSVRRKLLFHVPVCCLRNAEYYACNTEDEISVDRDRHNLSSGGTNTTSLASAQSRQRVRRFNRIFARSSGKFSKILARPQEGLETTYGILRARLFWR